MPELALALWGLYLALAFGLRIFLQWRRTGSTGVVGLSRGAGRLEWFAGTLFVVALIIGAVAPVLAVADVLEPIGELNRHWIHAIGVGLVLAGIGGTLYAQLAMGKSWRIGVDPEESTELVTDGPFALVRNPIYSAMLPTVAGFALIVPSSLAIAAAAALFVALELQVRVVEEPYLLEAQGEDYRRYAARTGRFIPGVGLIGKER